MPCGTVVVGWLSARRHILSLCVCVCVLCDHESFVRGLASCSMVRSHTEGQPGAPVEAHLFRALAGREMRLRPRTTGDIIGHRRRQTDMGAPQISMMDRMTKEALSFKSAAQVR